MINQKSSTTSAGMFSILFIPLILALAIVGALVDAIYEATKIDASILFVLPFLALWIFFSVPTKSQEAKIKPKRKRSNKK